jgi:D-alanine--poly(phosphoribitol) ligase subunit 1
MIDVLQKFFLTSEQNPNALAIEDFYGKLNYSEFAELVYYLGSQIITLLEPNCRILIFIEQGRYAYIGMLSTLYAGCHYSTINLEMPDEKIQLLVQKFDPQLILSTRRQMSRKENIVPSDIPCLIIDDNKKNRIHPSRVGHLAYVLFTSGSTGIPKGVMISRKALNYYVDWVGFSMKITPADRCSQHPNIAFDVSILDIYGAFCYGASLHPLDDQKKRYFPATFIAERQLTIWNSVPSLINLMYQAKQINSKNLSSVRLFMFCGEPLYPYHLEWLFAANNNCTVYNLYGPTEATISCTFLPLQSKNYLDFCHNTVALGEPTPGMRLFLDQEPKGELLLSGVQLADGYLNDPITTNEKFHVSEEGDRYYLTGDIVERINGRLYFIRRKDNQIKIYGHRIELEEIENALQKIGYATAIVHYDGKSLHAILETDKAPEPVVLAERMQKYIDKYAIPSKFYCLHTFPRNLNDKIDRLQVLDQVGLHTRNEEVSKNN